MALSNEGPKKTATPDAVDHHIVFVGGTTAVTKVAGTGQGVVVTYIGTGIVDITWKDNPGLLVNFQSSFQATTQSAVKGYDACAGAPSTGTDGSVTVRLNITNSAFTLADLAALQWCHLGFTWKRSAAEV